MELQKVDTYDSFYLRESRVQDFLTNYATKSIQTLWHPLTCKLTPVIKITGTENKIILLGDNLMLKIRITIL